VGSRRPTEPSRAPETTLEADTLARFGQSLRFDQYSGSRVSLRNVAVLAGACFVMLLTATPAAGQINRETCEGYPEPRVFMEAQTWWTVGRAATGVRSHHIHVGVCFPQGRTWRPSANGVVRLDFRIVFHNMHGYLGYMLRGGIGCCDNLSRTFHVPVQLRCTDMECTWWITRRIDTDVIKSDGRKEARFSLLTRTPKGKRMFASSGWQSYFARKDVSAVENYRDEDTAAARGWYEGFGYANASIGAPYRAPGPQIHGVWRPRVRMLPGADGFPVTSHSVHIDPMFHDGIAGIVVEKGPGAFDGAITINTGELTNGPHRLVVVTHARRIRPNDGVLDGTNTGVLSVPFFVQNEPLLSSAFPRE
jgi:hypothetical protein